ncbi:MAG: hypothetical protein LUG52_06655 [Clostridia bacterium]|nr:hypothetical protein [Clostridia bacterium]
MRKACEMFYTDVCDIYVSKPVFEDGRTVVEREKIYSAVPCRVSEKTYLFGENGTSEGDNLSEVSNKVKLFLPPDCEAAEGSEFEVTRRGKVTRYQRSGTMKRFDSHNEVMVVKAKEWA